MKKTILHFIYDLGRGGAETMLVRVLRELPEYNNIVVTLYEDNHFEKELECSKYICLHQGSILSFPLSALKLRKIIREHKVDIVHTHLFWPTLIARMGTPKNIPLISTIHAFIATSVEYKKWFIRLLDKWSFGLRRSAIIGVADGARNEYFSFLKLKPYRAYTLYTFVDTDLFRPMPLAKKDSSETLRLVSIGALRLQKNQQFLVEAFKLLKTKNIELHIFGMGPLQQQLQEQVDRLGVKVVLKGEVKNINEILPAYDLFVMSSTFEGFSLSVLEAMAMKVPMLLSEIVSFREQCGETATYFNLNDCNDFVDKLNMLVSNPGKRTQLAEQAYERVTEHFTLKHHMEELKKIYVENLDIKI